MINIKACARGSLLEIAIRAMIVRLGRERKLSVGRRGCSHDADPAVSSPEVNAPVWENLPRHDAGARPSYGSSSLSNSLCSVGVLVEGSHARLDAFSSTSRGLARYVGELSARRGQPAKRRHGAGDS